MKDVKGEIISIGTELLLGQICNTNAQWLSEKLSSYGVNIFYHTVAGDNVERVERVFQEAQTRSNLIIVTGGLGPTEDDLTRDAFRKLTNLPMYEHEPSLEKITNYFKNNRQRMTPNNRKQSLVFETAKVLTNKTGMAPGMIVNYKNVNWIFLPGVPKEMRDIFSNQVSSFLNKLTGQRQIIQSKMLRFVGIGEAELEHKLSDLIKEQTNPTIAPLAQDSGVALRLTVKANSEQSAREKLNKSKQKILNRVGSYCFGEEKDSLEELVVKLLKENNLTISSAESLTGGLFASNLISVKGTSTVIPGSIISYDAKIKEKVLGVSKETILQHGVVSEQCALEMASNVKDHFKTNIGISFTGVAGPTTLENKKAGCTYIGVCTDTTCTVYSYNFRGNRNEVRRRAAFKGLELIYKMLN